MDALSTVGQRFLTHGIRAVPHTRLCFGLVCSAILNLLTANALAVVDDAGVEYVVGLVDQQRYRTYLSAEDLLYTHADDNRYFGEEHDLVRDRIAATLAGFGLETSLHEFDYLDLPYFNVIAVQPGLVTPEHVYLVGAHFDSTNSRGIGPDNAAPGADDNASGVAGVLEAACVLSQFDFESTLIYAAFDREEQGARGSRAYVDDHLNDDIRGMISLDMIAFHPYESGNEDYNKAHIFYATDNSPLTEDLAVSLLRYGGITAEIGQLGQSDHMPFDHRGFDAALLIEYAAFDNPNYHMWSDSVDTIDYIDYAYGTNMTRGVVGYLATQAVVMAVPEPSTVLLLATGLASLLLVGHPALARRRVPRAITRR